MKVKRTFPVWLLLVNLTACLIFVSCADESRPSSDQNVGTGSHTLQINRYLECFEIVWQTVNDKYFDPTFGGVNWKEVHVRYKPLIAAAENDEAFYELINKMVFELNVSHIGIVPPDEKEQLEPIASAEGSIGVSLRLLDGVAVITSAMPGSPGERIGLRPGFIVQRIGGKTIAQLEDEVQPIPPLHERNERKRMTSKILEQLYGKPDTPVSIVYQDANDETRETQVRMTPRGGKHVSPDKRLPPVHERFAGVIGSSRDARGLIIDLRGNHGGMFFVRKPVVDHLVQERRLFWSYKGRNSIREVYSEPAKTVYAGPLVVLVDVMSASSAEEVAGGLQSLGRALIIGERTAGICLVMDAVTLPNGAVFVYPSEQTRTADGKVLEGRGVIPDIEVGLDRALLLKGIDSQLEAAIMHIKTASAKSIIAKCAEAMGGADGIKNIRALRLEVVYPDHDGSAVLHEIRRPNQIRTERPGDYVAIFDGRTGVLLKHDPAKPGQPPVPQNLPAEAARGFETDLIWFFPSFFDFPSEYAGIVESNGAKCHKLVVTLPLGTRAEYLVDALTYMVKTIAVDETYQGQTFHMEREWLDYKSVQGIIYPSRMTYPGRDGKTAAAELKKVEFNPILSEDNFKVPAVAR